MAALTKVNTVIDHFLKCSNSFSKEVETRLKLSANIKEFDSKLNSNVSLFVNLSNKRYKSVKLGNKLDSVITKQKVKYDHLSHEIMTDGFYNNDDIRKEKDKIEMSIGNTTEARLMNKIRNRIKILTKEDYLSKYLRKSKSPRQNSTIVHPSPCLSDQFSSSKKRAISEIENIGDDTTSRGEEEGRGGRERNHDGNDNGSDAKMNRVKFMKKNIGFISNMINDDNLVANNQFNEYRNYLNSIQEELSQKDNDNNSSYCKDNAGVEANKDNKDQLQLKHNKTDPKLLFSSSKFKLLSFNNTQKKVIIKEKPVDLSIDLQKIIKYTKRGKGSTWRLNHHLLTPSQLNKTNEMPIKPSSFTSYPNEKCNTLYKVKSEAQSFMHIEDKIKTKRARLNYLFTDKKGSLPCLSNVCTSDIDNSSNNNKTPRSLSFSLKKINSNYNTHMSNNNNSSEINNNKKKIGKDKAAEVLKTSLLPIYGSMEEIYLNKNKEWDKEERERQLNTQRPTQEELTTMHSFLVSINQLPRAIQLYADEYSFRNKDNEIISNFSKSLGSSFYNKKSLNRLIKGYMVRKAQNSINQNNKPKATKKQFKDAYDHLAIHKFNLKSNKGDTNMSEGSGALGNDNRESDYVPHYLKVKEKEKEEKRNEEYKELMQFRKFVESKLKQTHNKNQKRKSNRTVEVNTPPTHLKSQFKRRSSSKVFNLTQNSLFETPKNDKQIQFKKSSRKNSFSYPFPFSFKVLTPSNKSYVLNEFIIKKLGK